MKPILRELIFVSLMSVLFIQRAVAVEVIFTLDSSSTIYGTGTAGFSPLEAQKTGSDMTGVIGNFAVDIDDPTNPGTIQFLGQNGTGSLGFQTLQNTSGGAKFSPGNAPANLALQGSLFGQTATVAARNTTFDFNSNGTTAVITGGSFSPQLVVTPDSGEYDVSFMSPIKITGTVPVSNGADTLTSSNGALTLTLNGTGTENVGTFFNQSVNETIQGHLVAQATFGPNNLATTTVVGDAGPAASVLGGASQPGGVAVQFPTTATTGMFSAQQIKPAGLPYTALQTSGVFGLTLSTTNTQIWNLTYSGSENASLQNPISVTLAYDFNKLSAPLQADQNAITVEHFNETTNQWENLSGSVDTTGHTITVQVTSLSPMAIVPEPSSIVLGLFAAAGLGAVAIRKRCVT